MLNPAPRETSCTGVTEPLGTLEAGTQGPGPWLGLDLHVGQSRVTAGHLLSRPKRRVCRVPGREELTLLGNDLMAPAALRILDRWFPGAAKA